MHDAALTLQARRLVAWPVTARFFSAFLSLLLATALLHGSLARAHPSSDFNLRAVHFEPVADGMLAYYRLSLPLLLDNDAAPRLPDGLPRGLSGYTYDRLESGRLFHYVWPAGVRSAIGGLGRRLTDGHLLTVDGKAVASTLRSIHLRPIGQVPPFSSLEQARSAMAGTVYPEGVPETETRYVLVDALVHYRIARNDAGFQFASTLTAATTPDATINNIFFLHRDGVTATYNHTGDLHLPVTLGTSLGEAFGEFFVAGMRHILEGWDHLLFVICLVVGDTRWRPIAWRITAFSVGHTLSLAGGFYGWVPSAAWFQPWVEVTIAASLLLVAASIFARRRLRMLSLPLTALVGLVHGFGFAVGLRELLAESSVHVLPSLIAFNLGVEGGQICIALTAFAVLAGARHLRTALYGQLRAVTALCSAGLSSVWLIQRIIVAVAAG